MAQRTGSLRKSLRSAILTCLLVGLVHTVQQFYMQAIYRNGSIGWSLYLLVELVVFMATIIAIFNEKEKYEYRLLTFALAFSVVDISIAFVHLWGIHKRVPNANILWLAYILQIALIIFKIYSTVLFHGYLTEPNRIVIRRIPKVYYRVDGSPTDFQNCQVFYIIPHPSSTVPYPATGEVLSDSIQPPQYSNQTAYHTPYPPSPPPEYSRNVNQLV
ncbi:uncharacterized protein LOC135834614 [Planococcus citri]|uniref:uncharacterized protein LOC135834614 n=1 Tax=Planococcus citri TaxID=170843 RepID=UPI0031F8EFCF